MTLQEAIASGFQQKKTEWEKVEQLIEDRNLSGSILEIGNFEGASLSYFATKFKHVYGIDLNPIPDNELPKNVKQFVGDSKDNELYAAVRKVIVKGKRKGVDVLVIDGDHSYEGVAADFSTYFDLVIDGGLIILHDIIDSHYHRSANCNVSSLWNDIKNDGHSETMEFISEPLNWGGIGVIIKKELPF